jgi:hypothetical protein
VQAPSIPTKTASSVYGAAIAAASPVFIAST